MKLLGSITKKMFWNKEKSFISSELQKYTIPFQGDFLAVDIGRHIYLNETGQVVLESYKDKKNRELEVYAYEKEEPAKRTIDSSDV